MRWDRMERNGLEMGPAERQIVNKIRGLQKTEAKRPTPFGPWPFLISQIAHIFVANYSCVRET